MFYTHWVFAGEEITGHAKSEQPESLNLSNPHSLFEQQAELIGDFRLQAIPSTMPIAYKTFRLKRKYTDLNVGKNSFREGFHSSHDLIYIEFYHLSEEQFNLLKKVYSDGKSRVTYSPIRKTYGIVDFLPPVAQALLRSEIGSLMGLPIPAQSTYRGNCWNVAYEVARNSDELVTWFGEASGESFVEFINHSNFFGIVDMDRSAKDFINKAQIKLSQFFAEKSMVSACSSDEGECTVDNRLLFEQLETELEKELGSPEVLSLKVETKPGDIYMLGQAHAAVVIDQGLYFEVNNFNAGPPTLTLWKDLVLGYPSRFFSKHYRKRGPLPRPELAFPFLDDGTKNSFNELKIAFDSKGFAYFAGEGLRQ